MGLQYQGKLTKTGVRRACANCDRQVRVNRDKGVNRGQKEGDARDGKLQGPADDCNSVYADLLVQQYRLGGVARVLHGNL